MLPNNKEAVLKHRKSMLYCLDESDAIGETLQYMWNLTDPHPVVKTLLHDWSKASIFLEQKSKWQNWIPHIQNPDFIDAN